MRDLGGLFEKAREVNIRIALEAKPSPSPVSYDLDSCNLIRVDQASHQILWKHIGKSERRETIRKTNCKNL